MSLFTVSNTTPFHNTNYSSTRIRELQSCNLTKKRCLNTASFDFYLIMSERNVHKRSLTQAKKKRKYIQLTLGLADSGQTVDIEGGLAYRFSNGVPAVR